jgi:hypothetical protein
MFRSFAAACIMSFCSALVVNAPEAMAELKSFILPDDGQPNNNARIGPFCCTGDTAIVRSRRGDPIGYIYFYTWKGRSYNVGNSSIVPDFTISVSGSADIADLDSVQIENQISFQARSLDPRSGWVRAGDLRYRAILLDYEMRRRNDRPYFDMDSLRVRVDVEIPD